ncbi:acyltransferase [Natronococcus sp. JC468]|uniref:acyltransferase n=1 Tax=Natronococcus sp. JC468 TaxID=1961921 RepID=UPI00143B6950|nr:acyltransferase [Natronococcus sp. JC468]NKE37370.1 acyltransferase [Natronococcus sp. JC468]
MTGRIYSIDAMRMVAMAFVVTIHTDLFRGVGAYGTPINFVIDSTARFAVPFFFLAAGYFFAHKTADGDPVAYFKTRAVRIGSIYAFGLALAAPVFLAGAVVREAATGGAVASVAVERLVAFASPLELLYYGNSVSVILWFLPALLFSLGLVCAFARLDAAEYLLPVSLALHVVGLLGSSYTMFVDVPLEVRDALFFGFFYTSVGYVVASRDWQPIAERSRRYLGATLLFGALHLAERYALGYASTGASITEEVYVASYTVGTALFAISLFVFLLSRPNLGRSTPLPSWGTYAVGVYVAHPAVLFVLERTAEALEFAGYDVEGTLLWHLVLTPATFFGALFVYLAAHRVGAIEIGGIHLPHSLARYVGRD